LEDTDHTDQPADSAGAATADYRRATGVLGVGLAATGLVTFAFFALTSHALDRAGYSRIVLMWSLMFVVVSTIYRPIEQLLSREIAARAAAGGERHSLRVPIAIQTGFGVAFVVVALALHRPLHDDLFKGSDAVYWSFIGGVLTYGAAYFARGWLGGNHYFTHVGWLVVIDAGVRVLFPLAVLLGVGGEGLCAAGIAIAPLASLVVVPLARRHVERDQSTEERAALFPAADAALSGPGAEGTEEAAADLTLARGGRFAIAVLAIMLAEQTLLNIPVVTVDAQAADVALAGVVFNALLIARAPIQLFQAVQIALLPHLAGLEATSGRDAFVRAIRLTGMAIGGFTLAVAAGLLAIGPFVMDTVFGGTYHYDRWGLALLGIGMGFHLVAGTLNQAALARDHVVGAAVCWLVAAGGFLVFLLAAPISDVVLNVEVAYAGAAAVLAVLLYMAAQRHGRGESVI
jgi:O-antigen/teichoic acid export membrane protein